MRNNRLIYKELFIKLSLVLMAGAAASGCADVKFSMPSKGFAVDPVTQQTPTTDNPNDTTNTVSGPPVVSITSPIPGEQVSGPTIEVVGTCTDDSHVQISGSGVQSAISGDCVQGNFQVEAPLTPVEGDKEIIASQTNPEGTGSTSVTVTVGGGTNPGTNLPHVTIDSPSANSFVEGSVEIRGLCEAGLPVQHSGSGNASSGTVECANGNYLALVSVTEGDGTKNIVVRQTNSAGEGSDNRNFVRQGTAPGLPPVVTITHPAPLTSAKSGVNLQGTCESGLAVVLGGQGLVSVTQATCNEGRFALDIQFSANAGNKVIVARQTNAYGIGEASRTFIKEADDTSALPNVKITSPLANSQVLRNFELSGTCESGLQVSLSGAGLASSIQTPCADSAFRATVMVAGTAGDKLVEATQQNATGIGRDQRIFKFMGDSGSTPLPQVAITAPAANSNIGSGLELSGTCTSGLAVKISGSDNASESSVACADSKFTAPVVVTDGNGLKVITASQTNSAGTVSDSRAFNRSEDPTGPKPLPRIEITAPAADSVHGAQVVVLGICESDLPIQVAGVGVAQGFNASCGSGGQFQITVPLSPGSGSKNIVLSQTRPNVGTGTAVRNFIRAIEVLPPVVKIVSPAANSQANLGVLLSGTCTSGIQVQVDGSGNATPKVVSCTSGVFSVNVSFTQGVGVKNIRAWQTNQGGTSTDNRNFVRVADPVLGDLLLKDDFERNQILDGSPDGLSWTEVIHDFGGRTDNIDAKIQPGSVFVTAPSGAKSLYFRGRMGNSQHEIFLISRPIDLSAYSSLEISQMHLPIDLESNEYLRLEICKKPAKDCDPLKASDWVMYWQNPKGPAIGPLTNKNRNQFSWKSSKITLDLATLPSAVRKSFRFRYNVFLDEGIEIPKNTWPTAGVTYKMIDGVGLDLVQVRARAGY